MRVGGGSAPYWRWGLLEITRRKGDFEAARKRVGLFSNKRPVLRNARDVEGDLGVAQPMADSVMRGHLPTPPKDARYLGFGRFGMDVPIRVSEGIRRGLAGCAKGKTPWGIQRICARKCPEGGRRYAECANRPRAWAGGKRRQGSGTSRYRRFASPRTPRNFFRTICMDV